MEASSRVGSASEWKAGSGSAFKSKFRSFSEAQNRAHNGGLEAKNWALERVSVDQRSQIPIILMRCRVRIGIRINVKSWIRICNPGLQQRLSTDPIRVVRALILKNSNQCLPPPPCYTTEMSRGEGVLLLVPPVQARFFPQQIHTKCCCSFPLSIFLPCKSTKPQVCGQRTYEVISSGNKRNQRNANPL